MSDVLVVAAESAARDELVEMLGGGGCAVRVADSGLGAVDLIKASQPDVLLFFRRVDDIEPVEFVKVITETSVTQSIPVAVVGAAPNLRTELYRAGCADVIDHPVAAEELLLRVRRVSTGAGGSAGVGGDLSQISLVDIIQMLMGGRKTGSMAVTTADGSGNGQLLFEEGQVIASFFNDEPGEDAMLLLLRATKSQGSFQFVAGAVDGSQRNIEKRTDHLLLGLANSLDEE